MKCIATDLDRTLLPNGTARASKQALPLLKKELATHPTLLVFVTGRYDTLILKAIKQYRLPRPNYCIANVGTEIFTYTRGKLLPLTTWTERISKDWKGKTRHDIAKALRNLPQLTEQEPRKLNPHKQSYYATTWNKTLENTIRNRLDKLKIRYHLTISKDTTTGKRFLDITPKSATKETALNYLLKKEGIKKRDTLCCGDSGNDLTMLTSGHPAVLVKNASDEVRNELIRLAKKKNVLRTLYFPKGIPELGLNGNYAAGILEAAYHFGIFNKKKKH
ncbi:HAD-IIB family hydrolase [Candidatus Woesearchaeota archaeon]|nr:MAG: HAD-IIB family hydrolase [Candidatus Woesearchaeota archaeon]